MVRLPEQSGSVAYFFFGAAFLAAGFLAAGFLAAGFATAFLAAGFLAAGLLAAGFLAAGFSWWLKAQLPGVDEVDAAILGTHRHCCRGVPASFRLVLTIAVSPVQCVAWY